MMTLKKFNLHLKMAIILKEECFSSSGSTVISKNIIEKMANLKNSKDNFPYYFLL